MIPQEHRVIAALGHLGPFVVPGIWAPRWWQWRAKRRERAIRHALSAAGLPSPDYIGRVRLWSQFGEVAGRSEVSVVEWARAWCRVLDLPFMVGDAGFVFDPRSKRFSTMTAHERIQLLREEQALARPRTSALAGTDIPPETRG